MNVFDRMLGTRRSAPGAAAASAGELRAALLALGRPDRPWTVRDGEPGTSELLAEWRVLEPGWQSFFFGSKVYRLDRALQVVMRLDERRRRVLALDREWTVTWRENGPHVTPVIGSRAYRQGNIHQRKVEWTLERGPDGRRRWQRSWEFDTREIKEPLRDTVTSAGWTWKGRVLRP